MSKKRKKATKRPISHIPFAQKQMVDKHLRSAEASWQNDGDPEKALEILFSVLSIAPKYEPSLRMIYKILVAEDYHPQDIVNCLKELRKIRELRPLEKLAMGKAHFRLGNYTEALPLVEAVELIQDDTLESHGYNRDTIDIMIHHCQLEQERLRRPVPTPTKTRAEKKKEKPSSKPVAIPRTNTSPSSAQSKSKNSGTLPKTASLALLPELDDHCLQTELSASIESASDIISSFVQGELSGLEQYFLNQRASELARTDTFDHLLGQEGLRDVEQYEYQTETVRKVLRSFRGRVLLADEVGLGKTIEAGMVLREYILRGMVKRTLVLTPPALVSQWCEELVQKFDLDPTTPDSATIRDNPEQFWHKNHLIVASLALAKNKRHKPILEKMNFDLVIVDEAHQVKNHRTLGWKLINSLKSRFLILLSATPVENDLMDLYSLVTLLRPGQLGTRAAFRREYVLRGDPTQARNRVRLREIIQEVMIRNTRALADIKLPPRHATTVLVEGTPSEQTLYTHLVELVRSGFRKGMARMSLGILLQEAGSSARAVKRTLTKLTSRIDLDPELKVEMGKIVELCEILPTASKANRLLDILAKSKEKVLVFSRYTATLEELSERLDEAGVKFTIFTGGRSAAEKDAAVDAFQRHADVMLCSEIGGEGRNLQFCSTIVNYDLPWNPMKIEQRIGRIHRIGQTKPVHIYNLCSGHTAEENILNVLDRRLNLFELVIGEIDLVLGQLKTEQEFEERILEIYGSSRHDEDIVQAFEKLGQELLDARDQYEKIKKLDNEIFSNDYEI